MRLQHLPHRGGRAEAVEAIATIRHDQEERPAFRHHRADVSEPADDILHMLDNMRADYPVIGYPRRSRHAQWSESPIHVVWIVDLGDQLKDDVGVILVMFAHA